MIHIVFEQANVDSLKQTILLDPGLEGDIIEIKDDFAVGPLADLYLPEGYQLRRDWWKNLLEFSPYTEQLSIVDDILTVHKLCKRLDDELEETVWIWMGQNAHDVCGYYWLMSQLKEYQGRIEVLYLNNLPFFNEKGNIFYPTRLYEIQAKELLKAKKLARPITLSEFEVDPDEWKKICTENALVQFLEGGKKLVGKDVDFYDKDILSNVPKEPQKLTRVLSNTLNKMLVKTGDVFLVWRIRELINMDKLVVVGDWAKGWKELIVSFPGAGNTTEVDEITEA